MNNDNTKEISKLKRQLSECYEAIADFRYGNNDSGTSLNTLISRIAHATKDIHKSHDYNRNLESQFLGSPETTPLFEETKAHSISKHYLSMNI